jgi:hypothetical protein
LDLLAEPLGARAVAWDDGVLRVHFSQDAGVQQKIADFIALLSQGAEAA